MRPDGTLPYDVFIPDGKLKGGKNGDKAIVQIVDWPENSRNPIGRVKEILGKGGENETEMHAILAEYGLPYRYPEDVEKYADTLSDKITADELSRREDFRQVTYCTSYPRGIYAEEARYIAAMALYLDTPDPRLDQSSTIKAINEIQLFLEYYPYSRHKRDVQDMLFELQDRLVEKEYRAAQLYFNLGNYMGNNYQACVITAQNALKDYPYTSFREDLSFLVVKAKYQMAKESVVEKMLDRYRDAVDECYAFQNEFPESRYYKDSEQMLHNAQKAIKGL